MKNISTLKFSLVLVLLLLAASNGYAQWVPQVSGTANQISDVNFANATTGGACGIASTILRTTNAGANWVVQPNPAGANLWAIAYPSPLIGIVVGDGVLLRTTNGGTNWVSLVPPSPGLYHGVVFVDANTGFICGSGGSMMKSTNAGANWVSLSGGTTEFLLDLSFADANTGYIIGTTGLIIKTTNGGDNWLTLTSGVTNTLQGIAAAGTDTAYIATDAGTILKTINGGTNWVVQNTGTTASLNDIYFVTALTGTVVGASNTVMRTTNGGTNWLVQDPGVTGSAFAGAFFVSNTTGYAVGVGGTIIFTTTGGFSLPPQPNLTSPVNNAQNVPINPVLIWDSLPTAKTYDLQLATDTGFTANVIDTNFLNFASMPVQNNRLANNQVYYWRVRGVNIVGNGPWSTRFTFTTVVALPNAPILLYPANNASNVSLYPSFDWDSTSPADYYRLQVSSDSTFSATPGPEVDRTGLLTSNDSLTALYLQSNTRYYWRVVTTNAAGLGPWSAVFTFTTITTIPGPPILVSPPNNSGNISLTPLLDWRDDITSTNYQLQLSQDSNFSSTPLIDSTGFNASQLLVRSGLLINLNTYYWRVRTTNTLGTGPWSATWNFFTGLTPPVAPILLAPPDSSLDISTVVTLDWNNVPFAATYRIQISPDPAFGTFVVNSSGLNFSQYTTQNGQLQNNTQYYWRVNATNTAGTGAYSPVWRFKTVISAPIAAPNLLQPANGSVVTTLTPTLDWNDVVGANGYKVQVSTDSLFISPRPDTFVTGSTMVVPPGILNSNQPYYWRARAHNIGGYGPWSVVWKFLTSTIGITVVSTEIPKEYKLYNNYPNPFNPETKIRFDLPKTSNVRIVIYDLLGRMVAELLDRSLVPPGMYETSWNSAGFASGLYIYRIETGDFIQSKKMLLVK